MRNHAKVTKSPSVTSMQKTFVNLLFTSCILEFWMTFLSYKRMNSANVDCEAFVKR